MYKITFKMESPLLVFPFVPTFDGILRGAYQRVMLDNRRDEFEKLSGYKNGLYLHSDREFKIPFASSLFFDDSKAKESSNFWVKRFDLDYDYYIDFKGKVEKIETGKKQYKNYKIPVSELHSESVHFYFETGCLAKVNFLLDEYVPALGKKTSQGYGKYKSCQIERISHDDLNFYDYILRPYPEHYVREMLSREKFYKASKNATRERTERTPPLWILKAKEGINEFKTEYRSWKAPYGDPVNFDNCIIPNKNYII